ncbi:ChbG/HpnK family deacetylase [Enterococcus ureasiticus]|uniref:ChbG/HpnK family deacetylase n=1 Tax=Enterococcus ureasiticus TaxID=903984 RepID=A0A1E5GA31_9ENTE|nr:ChbG/HpnK family deacetylase [Enterococcus ureasiticus]OEG09568.1 hypothetical protein BCR21_14570 [Enterococcus ureasiticus]
MVNNQKKYLIISGDDYGLTKGVSEGILDALDVNGISDTNFIATSDFSLESLELAKKRNLLAMGIHLNLEIGHSVYYRREMDFLNTHLGHDNYYSMIENEFHEQINYLIRNGIALSHITYHKNIIDNSNMVRIIEKLALEYDVPVRKLESPNLNRLLKSENILMCDKKIINTNNQNYSLALLKDLFESVGDSKSVELVCHPGYVTKELYMLSSMTNNRQKEWDLFTSSQVKCMIKEMNFEIINYTQLKD